MNRTITVTGIGTASAKPDYIEITMDIEAVNKDYEKALAESSKAINKLQNAVVFCGYKKEDLKTVRFNIDTRYRSSRDRKGDYVSVFEGYVSEYKLKLSFDFDNKKLTTVISELARSGVNPEINIMFTVKNPGLIKDELLINATENARAKAEILCKASGNSLGDILSINYSWGQINVFSDTKYKMMDDCMLVPGAPMCTEYSPEIELEDIKVSDSVTFVWEIK